jgi:predicted NAD/FAD-binding protein
MSGKMVKKRIAIVGSGISGLSALYALRNTQHEVHLFEKEERLGGHTNTVTWTHNGKSTPVDTGFIVLNTATYRSSPATTCAGVVSKLTNSSELYKIPLSFTSQDRSLRDDVRYISRCWCF